MKKMKSISLTFVLTFVCAWYGIAQAQTPRVSTVNITAETDKVHIAAQGDVSEMRVDVSDEQGDVVFQSGAITGGTLDWNMRNAQGERVSPGTYLVTVTFHNAAGKLRKRVEQVTVAEDEKASTRAPSSSAPNAVQATITGAGTTGKIAKFTGAATIGNSVITESAGKIGIGTAAPNTTLSVVSTAANNPAVSAGNNSAGGIGVKGTSTNATGIGVLGIHAGTTGAAAGVRGETNSTADGAVGVRGAVNSTNPGYQAAAVLGTNKGTGSNAVISYGVWGDHAGSGTGVYGTSPHGTGVEGATNDGVGVSGFSASGTGVDGRSTSGIALGGVSISGQGVGGASTSNIGVFGRSNSSSGVFGESTSGIGARGKSTSGRGVDGQSDSSDGVYGFSSSGVGVFGESSGNDAVVGRSSDNAHAGVVGAHTGSGNGIYGESVSGFAGYFAGKVRVVGTLTKGGGSFQIDHPLDPANKYLSHSFVESPDMMNIYNGNVTLDRKGQATVQMPAYFSALNRDFRYQLTAIGQPGPKLYIAQKMDNNRFKIAGGKPGMEVSWMVTGIRHDAFADAHRIPVEEEKPEKERGTYLHPELFGQPADKGVERARQTEQRRETTGAAAQTQMTSQK